ncbi:MAG: hypothetical protein ABIS69_07005 [Sediminibacterium sp.]
MKKHFFVQKAFILFGLFTLIFINSYAANRFAVASGNWNGSIWAATAGGTAGSAATPTSSDIVTINANKNVTVNVIAAAKSITINGNLIFTGAQDLTIANAGSLVISTGAGIDFSSAGIIKGGGNNAGGILVTIDAGASLTTANVLGFTTGTGNTALTGSISIKPGNRGAPNYNNAIDYIFDGTAGQVTGSAVSNATSITINNTAGVTATNDLTTSTLTTTAGSILDMGTNILSVSTANHSGSLVTGNTTATPITAGITWGGSVVFNSASVQTIVSGNYNDINGSGGNRTLSGTDTVGIAGVFTPGTGTYTVAGSVVDFNGNGDQIIPTFTFGDLVVSNGGIKKIQASILVTCLTININDNASVEINADGGGKLNVIN